MAEYQNANDSLHGLMEKIITDIVQRSREIGVSNEIMESMINDALERYVITDARPKRRQISNDAKRNIDVIRRVNLNDGKEYFYRKGVFLHEGYALWVKDPRGSFIVATHRDGESKELTNNDIQAIESHGLTEKLHPNIASKR
jgi:hypothetical protein